jgi:ferric-dicitrate binding protein FerR (iron transport regulator)
MDDLEKEKIYAKWLNGSLSDKEKAEFEASDDFNTLNKIIGEIDTWVLPPVALEYDTLKHKISSQKKETKIIPLYRKLAVAASLLILFTVGYGLYNSNFSATEFSTLAGETKTIELPDGTKAILNGNSFLSYHEADWKEDRQVKMEGEVFFDIEKKGPFKVLFEDGEVNVLGTEFDVLISDDYKSIKCYEGKVKVLIGSQENVIEAGQAIDNYNTIYSIDETGVSWDKDYTRFKGAKLIEVLKALTLKYNFEFDHKAIDLEKRFTGQFINNDSDLALKMVFNPLNIKYKKTDTFVVLK